MPKKFGLNEKAAEALARKEEGMSGHCKDECSVSIGFTIFDDFA